LSFKKSGSRDKRGPRESRRNVTGKELNLLEEIDTRLNTLVELLQDKGVINKREYQSRVAMHLHEISKATAFKELDEEL
jgi:ribosome assembly protein YihI (activator of Der GTPase)